MSIPMGAIAREFNLVQADLQVISGMSVAGGDYTKYYNDAEQNLQSLLGQLQGNVPQSVIDDLTGAMQNLTRLVKDGEVSPATLDSSVELPFSQAFEALFPLSPGTAAAAEEEGGPASVG